MGIHHLTWRVTASGLEDEVLIGEAISALIGDDELVEIEKTTSYYGSPIFLISASTKQNKLAIKSLAKLGAENLEIIMSTIGQRLDENNSLHFRIGLDEMIAGDMKIVYSNIKSIKCRAKLEVYPGQSASKQAHTILSRAKDIAKF